MKKISLTLILLNLAIITIYSQSIALNTKSFYGMWNNETTGYFYGGGGLELLYEHPLKKGSLRGGVAFRTINWGNQLAINAGYKMTYITKEKWSLNGISSLGIGVALFRNKPLFVGSVMYMPEFSWHMKERLQLNIGFGISYTNCPVYKDYGSINQVLELPLKIGVMFTLGDKSPQ